MQTAKSNFERYFQWANVYFCRITITKISICKMHFNLALQIILAQCFQNILKL